MVGGRTNRVSQFDLDEQRSRPFGHELADKSTDVPELGATEFEKIRGVNRIETRTGFSGATVSGLSEPLMEQRLTALSAVQSKGLSIDFLKFTKDGLSFLIADESRESLRGVLEGCGFPFEILPDRSILTVHAANMRDEEGMVAQIVSEVISSGAHIDHMGDMHDRLLIVMSEDDAATAKAWLIEKFPGVEA